MPHETRRNSAQVLCTPYNHAPYRFMQGHIRKVYACLAVTCHLHFWQNDRDLLRATATYVSTESRPQRRKFPRRSCRDSNPRPFSRESGALTTELSPPPDWVIGFTWRCSLLPTDSLRCGCKWHVAMMMSWCLMSSDVIWHIRDKLWPMPKHGSIKATYVRCMRV